MHWKTASRIQPLLEFYVQTFEHFVILPACVRELAPVGDILVFTRTLNLDNVFVHEAQLVSVLFTEMLFADLGDLLLAVFGSEAHVAFRCN